METVPRLTDYVHHLNLIHNLFYDFIPERPPPLPPLPPNKFIVFSSLSKALVYVKVVSR